ncbi:response regulator [Hydrogenovibrio kuenenii]|uniref:response regulator n=1 Tax=Hydrogenovibrio kuenenii TaxID=63658 RepID=UPI000465327C|nr:response regulator [Hydrogenovibrio kuenenii]
MALILMVDDSNVTRSLVKLTLETLHNVQVDTAENAEQALSLCKKTDYDILILDYVMPNQTGLDLITSLNQLNLQKQTPIFILSSETDSVLRKRAQSQQVIAWLKKPFRPQTLLELISKTLPKQSK